MEPELAGACGRGSIGRLKRRAEFLRVAGGRRRAALTGLVLQVRRRSEAEDRQVGGAARVGFTVSRKVGCAVERNRARRRLRAAAGEVLPNHAKCGHDYVIIGRRQTLDRSFPALLDDLESALRRLHAPREPRRDRGASGAGGSEP